MKLNFKGKKIKLSTKIKTIIDNDTVYILENVGIPNKITPLGGIEYEILSNPYIKNDKELILGKTINTNTEHCFFLNIENNNIFHQWNYNNIPLNIFINSNIDKMLLCDFVYVALIRRLILSKSLGAYYDDANYEKYANLLNEIIFDIDEEATKKGAWCSLIQEMSIGAI